MYQCILNLPQLNDWSKVTYSQVNGSPVLKALSFKRLSWISVTKFAELIQFAQNPKFRRPWTFSRENLVFHWRKKDFIFQFHLYFSANFAFYFLVSYIYMAHHSILLRLNSFDLRVDRGWGDGRRDGGLSTLCHSCVFACQQKVLETFPDPGYLRSEDGVVWLWHSLEICIYGSPFHLATAQSLWS